MHPCPGDYFIGHFCTDQANCLPLPSKLLVGHLNLRTLRDGNAIHKGRPCARRHFRAVQEEGGSDDVTMLSLHEPATPDN